MTPVLAQHGRTSHPQPHPHARAHSSHGKSAAPLTADERHEQMTDQAQKWVAQTFYGTLLKQMRDDPFKNETIDGGRGGQVFSEMFDQHLAEHMSKSTGSKLVHTLVKKMEGAAAYRKQIKPPARKGLTPGDSLFRKDSLFTQKA